LNSEYVGKVTLFDEAQLAEYEGTGAIGAFKRGTLFHLIKAVGQDAAADLKPYNGKECKVYARIRNQGKYILVERVVQPGAENTFRNRRGGV